MNTQKARPLPGMTKDEEKQHKKIILMFYVVLVVFLTLVILITGLVAGLFAREVSNLKTIQNRIQERESSLLNRLEVSSRRDCNDVYDAGYSNSGVYNISIHGNITQVYCDMNTDGGKWLVFQRRVNDSVDFYRNWVEYKNGFGHLQGNFWLGLDSLHYLTSLQPYVLRVDLKDWDGNTAYAQYRTFIIQNNQLNYQLEVAGYSGTAGDSFTLHNSQFFSTKDQDNDVWDARCSLAHLGGWWYKHCLSSNLNGKYFFNGTISAKGITWHGWKRNYYSMKRVDMKIRRA